MKKNMTFVMAAVLAASFLATGCGNKAAETKADTKGRDNSRNRCESKEDGETAAAAGERDHIYRWF